MINCGMERISTITDSFFNGIPVSILAQGEDDLSLNWSDISGIMSKALIVFDFQKKNFLYVSSHDFLSCGYTPDKIKDEGCNFFETLIHPDDLHLGKNILTTLLISLYNSELPAEKVNFFGCTLRIRSFLSDEYKNPDYLMV